MKWFKFYGQDFLTDSKMRLLTVEEKMCWIVLLCLANSEDKGGLIMYVSETEVMRQAGIDDGSPMWVDTRGFLDRFSELNLLKISDEKVTKHNVTHVSHRDTNRCSPLRYSVYLLNFEKRQDTNLSGSERQKKYKERLKTSVELRHKGDVAPRHQGDARVDKIRVDKNIYSASLDFLKNVPELVLYELSNKYKISNKGIQSKATDLLLYCQQKGKKYRDYKAFLENAIRKDKNKLQVEFPLPIEALPRQVEAPQTPEQTQKNREIRAGIANMLRNKTQ